MSNRIPFISAKRQPDEQGDIDSMKCNYRTLGEQLTEAGNSNATPADDIRSPDNNNSITSENEVSCFPEDGDDRLLLIEDRDLTSRTVITSPAPPPPPPPPPSFGSMKPQPPSTPPPSPPLPSLLPPQLGTADKAVQLSPPFNANRPLRHTEIARTVHTYFNEPQSCRNNPEENTDGAVQTAAIVHAEDPEVKLRSSAVPLALAAPCRSKPRRCAPSTSYERGTNSRPNGQIINDSNNCAAGGDASSVAISSAGSSSPRYGFEDFHERISRGRNSHDDELSHKESCMESCVYCSVKCCECIVL